MLISLGIVEDLWYSWNYEESLLSPQYHHGI